MELTATCSHCGTAPSSERPAFTWACAVRFGDRTWTCGPCVRGDLRRIEWGLV